MKVIGPPFPAMIRRTNGDSAATVPASVVALRSNSISSLIGGGVLVRRLAAAALRVRHAEKWAEIAAFVAAGQEHGQSKDAGKEGDALHGPTVRFDEAAF